ncbi:hypothetical protein [Fodinibius halophilus]|uniref:SLATT domain-containing protein n=1 Tax=Fodinibius halophilus TaxID=1736908 RepID=A0A6M1TCY0_9BACT|nr:hypothetical protein [Fodinibius halophilus]NGP90253.1 hypothetical protein [Fodinibius halophilus]
MNLGNLGSFNFEMPKPNIPNLGQPPREIDLSPEEAFKVKKIMSNLASTGLTVDSLFDLFNDWQSNKTKSTKRFVLSFSFILSLTIVAGVNITEIDLFGVSVQDEMSALFLSSLATILVISFFYYIYLQNKDWEVHTAKTSYVDKSLKNCLNMVEQIDDILTKKDIKSAKDLFDDFKSSYDKSNLEFEAYQAIKFYKNNLKDTRKSIDWVEKLELWGICILNFLALIAIITSF